MRTPIAAIFAVFAVAFVSGNVSSMTLHPVLAAAPAHDRWQVDGVDCGPSCRYRHAWRHRQVAPPPPPADCACPACGRPACFFSYDRDASPLDNLLANLFPRQED